MFPAAVLIHCVTDCFSSIISSVRDPWEEFTDSEYYCVWTESVISSDRMSAGVVMKDPCVQFSSNLQGYCFLADSFLFKYLKRVTVYYFSGLLFLISSRKLNSKFPSLTLFFKRPKLLIAEKCVKQTQHF
jgi:hypothetical protein